MTQNQRHLANCFEISAGRFPGGDTNGRDAGGELASRYIKCLFRLNGSLFNVFGRRFPSTEVRYRIGVASQIIPNMPVAIVPLKAVSLPPLWNVMF